MPVWGLSESGWFRPRLPEIVTELDARWKSRFGANRNTTARTVDGKILRFVAEGVALAFEGAEGAYQGNFLDTSDGAALELLAAGKGFVKNEAVASTVTLTLGGTVATPIPQLSIVRHVATGRRFVTTTAVEIGVGGDVDVLARAEETGPFAAVALSTWEIVTPVTGWNTVANDLDADVGRNEETNAEFRQRIRNALREGGLTADLLRLLGVTAVTLFENDTDIPDPLYGATHWVEALVVGGDDQEIVNTIFAKKAPGIGTQGDSVGIETISGDNNEVRYSRGSETAIWLDIEITAGENFVGDATEIRDGIVAWADLNHTYGDDVAPAMLAAQIPGLTQGRYSVTVLVGTSDPPGSSAILTIPDREIARFDTSRTTVTIS